MKSEKAKRTLLIWLAIYPLITILFYLLGDVIKPLPIPIKTMVLTLIAVPTVVYVILPFYMKLFKRWL
jgi:antibiotic biosynthesis monooxygenase (ABM) superfamily enzyme